MNLLHMIFSGLCIFVAIFLVCFLLVNVIWSLLSAILTFLKSKNFIKLITILVPFLIISCGKSDEELSSQATTASQKELTAAWTKSDGSKAVDLSNVELKTNIYMYFSNYISTFFVYNDEIYYPGTYYCFYTAYWDGDEVSGSVTLTYHSGEDFCNEGAGECLYEVTGGQLSFYKIATNETALYY